ncbi:16S rRNA (guanine(527)-N(7))-methyltransferase RsmG [Chelatococcus sambhunathii]|uniref:Ribosomal RNA small subunit methyltransferase G n=1 Tax=Chelatococcus sambhunathii TaxID=363953 RepID=A0ABU1DFS7_9HYPH|nr:16S rRNA (guanine(527)-N(7))-methyltransferase RsmG [Chelatococcus sambhunathii]MDR4306895.1 16S rRNA (guanine(527)-N(7))-methyltransferase RsmG [Chelatococcus sambhunathii]
MSDARAADRAAAERLIDVSRETWARLDALVAALDRWQAKTNLVAPNTLDEIWTRHVADSAQLVAPAPANPKRWVDIGSGGGFPGLVIAAMLAGRTAVHLVESNGKKAAFLREAARAMGVTVVVHAERAEKALAGLSADVVSARALAPLTALLGLAAPLLKTGAVGLFPKGREASTELTEAEKSWRFRASLHPSLTDEHARIVRVETFDGPAG